MSKVVLQMRSETSIKTLTKMAMMATITFVGIYAVKVPVPNGYVHIGDCMIFLSVLLLGAKRGALAGGIGAAMADLLAGYMHWVFPTFIIKYIMAVIMGQFVEKIMPTMKWNWLIGAAVGGIVQIILYFVADTVMFGMALGIADIPGNVIQTVAGIILTGVMVGLFNKSGIMGRLKDI